MLQDDDGQGFCQEAWGQLREHSGRWDGGPSQVWPWVNMVGEHPQQDYWHTRF